MHVHCGARSHGGAPCCRYRGPSQVCGDGAALVAAVNPAKPAVALAATAVTLAAATLALATAPALTTAALAAAAVALATAAIAQPTGGAPATATAIPKPTPAAVQRRGFLL